MQNRHPTSQASICCWYHCYLEAGLTGREEQAVRSYSNPTPPQTQSPRCTTTDLPSDQDSHRAARAPVSHVAPMPAGTRPPAQLPALEVQCNPSPGQHSRVTLLQLAGCLMWSQSGDRWGKAHSCQISPSGPSLHAPISNKAKGRVRPNQLAASCGHH